jgi:Cu/Ag efflux pump CusA
MVAAGAVVVAGIVAAPFLGSSLVPTFKEQQLLVRWEAQPGTSLPEMQRVTGLASRELRAVPGVTEVGSHVGRAIGADSAVGANSAEMWVSIDPDADYDAALAAIQDVAGGYPGIEGSVESFSNDRSQAILTGAEEDVVVRIYGEDSAVLQEQAKKVQAAIAGVKGISAPRVKTPGQEPTLEVEVDLARAQQVGIKPGDVRRAAATLLGGIHVGSLFEEQKVFDVIVWGTPDTRRSLTSIGNLLIDTPEGDHVRLRDVADVRIAPQPRVINRQNVSRYLDVAVSVNGRSVSSVVSDVESRLSGLTFPLEYHVAVLGAEGQPTARLIGLAIGAAVAIFLLLQASFGSWGLAALCFTTLPVAGAGAVLAALAAGGDLSIGSLVGLIAVIGLAVRNGLALIARFRSLEEDEGERLGPTLVVRAASERLGPVALTALATGLAMLPVAVVGGVPGFETIQPLSIVMLGGLLTSTLMSLFVLPALYLRVAPRLRFETETEEIGGVGFIRRRVAQQPRTKEPVLRHSETSVEPSP